MSHDVLSNLGAFVLQAVAVVGAAAVLLHLLRVTAPGPRYVCWRLVLAACLLMPWLLRQPAVATTPIALTAGDVMLSPANEPASEAPSASPDASSERIPGGLPWRWLLMPVIALGAVARGSWLAIGWIRLCALSRRSVAIDDEDYREIQHTLGTAAALRSVKGVTQPATFGVFRPVVLLPASLADAPPARRRAVVTHELFHVQRHDWGWVLAEEALRSVLWFHPAIVWATSRIQLAREELVDELTVLATGNRRAYIEALLAFADAEPMPPAPAFARHRHLFTRIVGLSKERVMSSPRIVFSTAAVLVTVLGCGWSASRLFPVVSAAADAPDVAADVLLPAVSMPLVAAPAAPAAQGARSGGTPRPGPATAPAPAPPAPVGHPVTPENPIPRRVYSVPAVYPQELQGSGYGAAVEVRVLVDASGVPTVTDARRTVALSQPNPDWLAARAGVTPGAPPASLEAGRAQLQGLVAQQQAAKDAFLKAVLESIRQWRYDAPAEAPIEFSVSVLFGPDPNGVVTQSADPRGVSAVNGRAAVGTFTPNGNPADAAGRVSSPALAELDRQQLELMKLRGDLVLRLSPQHPDVRSLDTQIQTLAARRAALVAELQKSTAAPTGAVRVGGNIKPPAKTRNVNPTYPPEAQASQVSGVVILDVTIDEAGHVVDARILRSVPLLDAAAIEAVRQWEFEPTLLNGKPIAITMTVTVQFSLIYERAPRVKTHVE